MYPKLKSFRDYKTYSTKKPKYKWFRKKYERGHWSRVSKCGVDWIESELTKELSRHIQEHIDRQIIEEIKRLKVNDQTKIIQKI